MTGPPKELVDDVERHRQARDRRLRAGDGWLALLGRWVLDEGTNNALDFGASATLAPDGAVSLALADGRTHAWAGDAPGPGPFFVDGDRRWELLRQGPRTAVRVRSPQSPALRAFTGLEFYAPDARFRVDAVLDTSTKKTIQLATGLGVITDNACPGTLSFLIDGARCSLDPVIEDDAKDRLFINFKDATNGDTTYGAGRFLYAPLPDAEGRVVIDFNKSYNPPCALTEFAACPVAPPQNRLPVRIEAGEKTYRSPTHSTMEHS